MYVTVRAWRANEGGTTDLADYSETATMTERCLKTKLQIYTTPRNGTYILCVPVPLLSALVKCQMFYCQYMHGIVL